MSTEHLYHPAVNSILCTGCGSCASICPAGILSVVDGVCKINPAGRCIRCGHCAAACPSEAVYIDVLDPWVYNFNEFKIDQGGLPFGSHIMGGPKELAALLGSRRSCRNFSDKPVSKEQLEDLIRFAILAPSGTNSQAWTFTVLDQRSAVEAYITSIKDFFIRLNKMAERKHLRTFLARLGKPELDQYHKRYYRTVSKAVKDWEEKKIDRLFHSAPAVLIISTTPDASCPKEDALLASQNVLLAAHLMGLGTCLIGFAVAAMTKEKRIAALLGIPKEETVHAVIAIGHPKEKYARMAGRMRPKIRYFQTGT